MQIYYKPAGQTMKQFISELQRYYSCKITYVAKLDPLASGVVPVIKEKEFAHMEKFIKSNKTYTVNILFGISTDSTDALGIVKELNPEFFGHINTDELQNKVLEYLNSSLGTFKQEYHYFSSKRIYTRYHNKKDKPVYHTVSLYSASIIESSDICLGRWVKKISKLIKSIDNEQDFRQTEILEQWDRVKKTYSNAVLNMLKIELQVSSGFFVRQLIADMSKALNIPMIAYNIVRVHCSET